MSVPDFIVITLYAFVILYLLAVLFNPSDKRQHPASIEQEQQHKRDVIGHIPHNPKFTTGDAFTDPTIGPLYDAIDAARSLRSSSTPLQGENIS